MGYDSACEGCEATAAFECIDCVIGIDAPEENLDNEDPSI